MSPRFNTVKNTEKGLDSHVTPTGLNGARYYDQEFNPESSDIEVFIGIREKEKAVSPGEWIPDPKA